MSATTSPWTELAPFPLHKHCNLLMVDLHKFITFTPASSAQSGIYCYNTESDAWTLLYNYPIGMNRRFSCDTIAMDESSDDVFAFNSCKQSVVRFDAANKVMTEDIQHRYDCGGGAASVVVDGEYHVIGGKANPSHLIWNSKNQTFRLECERPGLDGFIGHGLLHIKCHNELLLFGGCEIENKTKFESDVIWNFPLSDSERTWNEGAVYLPYGAANMGYVLTNDDKYVILLKGHRVDVLHVDSLTCYATSLRLPGSGRCHSECQDPRAAIQQESASALENPIAAHSRSGGG